MQQQMQTSAIQPITQLHPLDPNYTQFQISMNFPDFYELNARSPAVACATARDIQNHVQQGGNPIRVNAFNVISQNQYQNQIFQELVRYILVRIHMGFRAGEFQAVDPAADKTIKHLVKYFSAFLALQNQQVLQMLTPDVVAALQNDAQQWEYQRLMCANQAAFVPFSTQELTDTLGSFNPISQFQSSQNLQNSGAFVVGAHQGQQYQSQYVQNGNNAQPHLNRYQRQLQEEKQMLQGSMQTALSGISLDETRWDAAVKANKQQLEARGIPTTPPPGQATNMLDPNAMAQAIQAAQQQAQQVQAVEDKPEIKSFLFSHKLGADQQDYGVVRRVAFEDRLAVGVVWKPTKLQVHHPAVGQQGQQIAYHELENGQWLAVIEEDKKIMEEKLFDYDAHAINPQMGIPDPAMPAPEVVPEAKVEFAEKPAAKRQLNVVCTGKASVELTEESILQSTVAKARRQSSSTEAYLGNGIVLDTVMFDTPEAMAADLEVVSGLVVATTYEAAVSQMGAIANPKLRLMVDARLTKAVNRWLVYRAGQQLTIGSFEEDAASLYGYLVGADLQLIADRFKKDANALITGAMKVYGASTYGDILNALMDVDFTSEQLARSLVVMENTAALWVNQTEEQLGIVMPEDQACSFTKRSLPWLHALAECALATCDKDPSTKVKQITLVTADDKRLVLTTSCLSNETNVAYLIRRPFDKVAL